MIKFQKFIFLRKIDSQKKGENFQINQPKKAEAKN